MHSMNAQQRGSPLLVPLIVAAVLFGLLALYVTGYYAMGKVSSGVGIRFHVYPMKWQADLYAPAAHLESLLIGSEVVTAFKENP